MESIWFFIKENNDSPYVKAIKTWVIDNKIYYVKSIADISILRKYNILDKNKCTDPILICKANLLLALANTVKGDTKLSGKILDDKLKEYSLDNMDSFIVSRWNFIDILNKFKDYNVTIVGHANRVTDNEEEAEVIVVNTCAFINDAKEESINTILNS